MDDKKQKHFFPFLFNKSLLVDRCTE